MAQTQKRIYGMLDRASVWMFWLKRHVIFLLAAWLSLQPAMSVARPLALNWNNSHPHADHNWHADYVWGHSQCLSYTTNHPDLLILGDSIFDGWSGYLLHVFPGAVVDARVSRQFSTGVNDYQNLMQYEGIRRIRTIVVELGTNGPITKSQVRRFMAVAGSRTVIWITPSVPRPWQNEVLQTIYWAASIYPHIHLVHWHALAQGHSQWFRGGGVHPNWSGIQQEVSALQKVVYSVSPLTHPS